MSEEQTFSQSWATVKADVIYQTPTGIKVSFSEKQIDRVLTRSQIEALAKAHLQACEYRLEGYWIDDEFYDEIIFSPALEVAWESSSLKAISNGYQNTYLIKLDFILSQNQEEFSQLSLIFNPKMEFVAENWSIDVESPFVRVKQN